MATDFLTISKRFLDLLGSDGVGSEWDQVDFSVSGIEPRWVLFPESVEQLANCLRICNEQGLSVVPIGHGKRLAEAGRPVTVDVVLSTLRLERLLEHAAADMTVVVDAGTTLSDLNEALARGGQWLPFDPPFPSETTVGGLIASQPSGPRRQSFGTVRESLIGLQAVLADGTIVRSGGQVVKNVAGYDLHRLLVGSFGTLAIVVEAAFRCQPLPEMSARTVFTGTTPVLCLLAGRLAASSLEPEVLELLLPESGGAQLLVEFAGGEDDLKEATRRAITIATEFSGVTESGESVDLEEQIEQVVNPKGDAVVLRAGVAPAALVGWLGIATVHGSVCGRVLAHAHAGIGVARIRIEESRQETVRPLLEKLRHAAIERGGYVVVERAPTDWNLDVWGPSRVSLDLLRATKHAFDPGRRLSPGRFVGGI